MRAVIQRVTQASVSVDGAEVSSIGKGLLTLLGIHKGDDLEKVRKMITRICELRIFEDDQGKMNQSLLEIGGEHLIVSQFTLAGDCSSGRRPSFTTAERPEIARELYERALEHGTSLGVPTRGGVFQADMKISLTNDGPVTFVLES